MQEGISKYKKLPENGLALFYGWYIDENGKEKRGKFEYHPPKPIKRFQYRCDKRFHTEFIIDLYQTYNKYGVLLLTGQKYKFYELEGSHLNIIYHKEVKLPNNHCRGGYSQNRLERLRQEAIHIYLKHLTEDLESKMSNIIGLIIVGNGEKKDQIRNYLNPEYQELLIGTITGLDVDIDQCLGLIHQDEIRKNKKIWDKIEELIRVNPDKLSFGNELRNDVEEGIIKGIVKKSDLDFELDRNLKVIDIPNYDPFYHWLSDFDGVIGIKY